MITVRVTPDDGDAYTLTATSRDLRLWEKAGKNRSTQGLLNNLTMDGLYEVVHLAAKRRQLFTGSLDEFAERHDLEPVDDEEEDGTADPTRPERSTGS